LRSMGGAPNKGETQRVNCFKGPKGSPKSGGEKKSNRFSKIGGVVGRRAILTDLVGKGSDSGAQRRVEIG